MPDDVVRAKDPVALPTAGAEGKLWEAVLDLSDQELDGWTLVGGLMVMLHAIEAGVSIGRATKDVDAVAASRAVANATRKLSSTLLALGWDLDAGRFKGERTGFRFERDGLLFDVLAPDGLSERTDITTVPPAQSITVAGGTRALQQTEHLAVRHGDREGIIPRPDVLGALVIKSRAAVLDKGVSSDPARRPERHAEDLAVLYACAGDPTAARAATAGKDVKHLRAAPEPTWEILPTASDRAAGQAAHRILTG